MLGIPFVSVSPANQRSGDHLLAASDFLASHMMAKSRRVEKDQNHQIGGVLSQQIYASVLPILATHRMSASPPTTTEEKNRRAMGYCRRSPASLLGFILLGGGYREAKKKTQWPCSRPLMILWTAISREVPSSIAPIC